MSNNKGSSAFAMYTCARPEKKKEAGQDFLKVNG